MSPCSAWTRVSEYFVCYALDGFEVLIDNCQIPPETLDTWPRLAPNSAALSRFIYGGTKDTMRGVTEHVSVGRAARKRQPMDHWFVLCRRDSPPRTAGA